MSSTEEKSKRAKSFAELMKEIMNARIKCLIISKMLDFKFTMMTNDRLVIQNENGILAYLVMAGGGEFWWCDDGHCYLYHKEKSKLAERFRSLDIKL